MKLKASERKTLARLVEQHDGLPVGPIKGKTMAYPVWSKGRVSWWRQGAMVVERDGRAYHAAGVARATRPANAVAILQTLLD